MCARSRRKAWSGYKRANARTSQILQTERPRRVRKNAARPLNRSVSRCDGPDDLEAGQSMTRQATPRLASPPVRPPAAPSKSDSRLDRRDLSSVYREIAVQYCVDSPDHAWIHHSLVNEHEQQSLATPRSCLAKMPSTKPSIVLRSGSSSMETSTNNSSAATATKRCPRQQARRRPSSSSRQQIARVPRTGCGCRT